MCVIRLVIDIGNGRFENNDSSGRQSVYMAVRPRPVSSRPIPLPSPIPPHTQTGIGWISTYTGQLDTAVTAFRGSSSLLEVQGSQLATGGLDDPGRVGGRVVSVLMN